MAQSIVESLEISGGCTRVLEIGPGEGVLTKYLVQLPGIDYCGVELDRRLVPLLHERFGHENARFVEQDILKTDWNGMFTDNFEVIGNFPYNISSQIVFKVLETRDKVTVVVGMFQKEVAQRICAGPGTKKYGIISVLLQVWYDAEYLFEVESNSFRPPPNVVSAVIRMKRNNRVLLPCDESRFRTIVKAAFNTRRKMLRNSLKSFTTDENLLKAELFSKRPEQISIEQFFEITKLLNDE